MSSYFQKYCPTEFESIIHNKHTCNILYNISKTTDVPHIAICGQKGTGKKTMIRAFLKEMYGRGIYDIKYNKISRKYNNRHIDFVVGYSQYHFEINPSLHSVYDRLVTQDFVKEVSRKMIDCDTTKHNTIIIHDADKLTIEAQQSLRSTLEHNILSCRFIFIVNNIENLIDPLQSRCVILRTSVLNTREITQIINHDIQNEGSNLSKEQINDIIEHSENDLLYGLSLLYVKICEEKGTQISDKLASSSLFMFEEHTNILLNYITGLHSNEINIAVEKKMIERFRNMIYDMLLVIDDSSKFIEVFIDKLFKYMTTCDERLLRKSRYVHLQNLIKIGIKYEETLLSGSKEIYHLEALILNIICELLGLNS